MLTSEPTEPRRPLSPSTVETLWYLIDMQYVHRTRWVERYFPAVADRGALQYGDIEKMDSSQAEAACHLLTEQILYCQSRLRKAQARAVTFRGSDTSADENGEEYSVRIRLYRRALADVCDTFGMANPMT